ncbi:MAG: inorganic phosphate transporter, partial [Bacteroidales bacterium]|nr:inorganic phosphate transporter [Bacteroidales bacterium]
FDQSKANLKIKSKGANAPYFDLIRASVNLVVASILISLATSMKLPLSTTYVTFMVAMGTSMSDRAWGRESAVYRITGVFSVIGGWFFTAFFAFSVAFLMALFISYGSFVAIFILIGVAIFIVFRTHIYHKRKYRESETAESVKPEALTGSKITQRCSIHVRDVLEKTSEALDNTLLGLEKEDFRLLKRTCRQVNEINEKTKKLKDNISETVKFMEEDSIETGHYYVQVVDYLREIAHSINFIITPSLKHVDNNHKAFLPLQFEELKQINDQVRNLLAEISAIISKQEYQSVPNAIENQQMILKSIGLIRKKHVKRIKTDEVGTKNSILYLDLLAEIKNLTLYSINLLKSHRDFVLFVNGNYEKVLGKKPD